MTVSSEVARTDYVGNGSVAAYATTFTVKATSEVRVFVQTAAGLDSELTLGVDFSAVLSTAGLCTITLTAGNLANGYKLSLQRGIPYTQTYDATASGAYSPANLATAIDRLEMQLQRIKGDLARAIKIPYLEAGGDTVTKVTLPAADRAGQALIFDGDGNATVGAGFDGVTATAWAQTLLDDANAAAARTTLELSGLQAADGAADTVLTTTGAARAWQKATNANLATMATQTIKGRTTAGTGAPEDLTAAQAAAILPAVVGDSGAGGTKGMVPAPAAGDAAAGKSLLASGLWGTLPFWAKVSNATAVALTTAASATLNRLHVISGTSADYTITISGLSPAVGDVLGFYVADYAAASKQFKLDAGGTVKIAGRTRYLVLIHTNVLLLHWDGTDWQPLACCLDTPWIDGGEIGITAVTTNPTKGTVATDKVHWRRSGGMLEVRYSYRQTGAGSAGSGNYLYALPIGAFASSVTLETGAIGGTQSASGFGGASVMGAAGSTYWIYALPYASGTFRLVLTLINGSGIGFQSNTLAPLSGTVPTLCHAVSFPLADW